MNKRAKGDIYEARSVEILKREKYEVSPCLIDGILRKGHKMLISGPSKAGKSFLQIELCIAIAEGKKWLQWNCAQGRVMYVNLELDRASCLHRFKAVSYTHLDVYKRQSLLRMARINGKENRQERSGKRPNALMTK